MVLKLDRDGDRQENSPPSPKRRTKPRTAVKIDAVPVMVAEADIVEVQVLVDEDVDPVETTDDENYTYAVDDTPYEQEPLSHEISPEEDAANDWQEEVAKALRNANGNKS